MGSAFYHFTDVANSYIVEYSGDSVSQSILQRRIYGSESVSPYVVNTYRNVGSGSTLYHSISANNTTTYLYAVIVNGAFTNANLAGTGTRTVVASSTGVLSATGAEYYAVQALTASASVSAGTALVRMTGTGFTATLPAATATTRVISFRNSGTGNLTIACNGAETLDGANTLIVPVGGIVKICDVASGAWETVL
jgi:hypothetical protein